MKRERILRLRVKTFTWIFIVGLVFSGVTAIPLRSEVDWLVKLTRAQDLVQTPGSTSPPAWALWLTKVQAALHELSVKNGFLFYGTDWLAFGHFMIALV